MTYTKPIACIAMDQRDQELSFGLPGVRLRRQVVSTSNRVIDADRCHPLAGIGWLT